MVFLRTFGAARGVFFAGLLLTVGVGRSWAGVITFSDQPTGDLFVKSTPYDSSTLSGLPSGVTLTFSSASGPGFESFDGGGISAITDHTHLAAPTDTTNEFIVGDATPATLTFNMPVDIVSLYVDRNTNLGASNSRTVSKTQPTVKGYLNGMEVFSFTNTAAANTWVSVSGDTVDTVVFTAFLDNMIDDIDVELPSPEPSTALPLSAPLFGLALRKHRLMRIQT